MVFDVIVIGAGAAGMMCAATAGQRGRRVLIIDHAEKRAEKIRISGGGRCNFTNLHCTPDHFLSRNPDFCRSALARYTPRHFIDLVERHGIAWHEKTAGQLFCDDSSQRIIDLLVRECEDGSVRFCQPAEVLSVRAGGLFEVQTSQGSFRAAKLVIATGGLSIPQIGASPLGYQLAEQFGHSIVPPKPALVPLTLAPEDLARYSPLAGVSFDAAVRVGKRTFRDNVLITHRGVSGPAILQISSYWQAQEGTRDPLEIDLLPDTTAAAWTTRHQGSKAPLGKILGEHLPQRFASAWAAQHEADQPFNQTPKTRQASLAQALKQWQISPNGTQGYRKAEVTLGGVDTRELHSRSMESLRVEGLYFVGEVVDVTGQLGGFNFQWAWSSGHAAGSAV